MITVKQLIEKLQQCDEDSIVVQRGYESGCDDIREPYEDVMYADLDGYSRDGYYSFSETGHPDTATKVVILGSAG